MKVLSVSEDMDSIDYYAFRMSRRFYPFLVTVIWLNVGLSFILLCRRKLAFRAQLISIIFCVVVFIITFPTIGYSTGSFLGDFIEVLFCALFSVCPIALFSIISYPKKGLKRFLNENELIKCLFWILFLCSAYSTIYSYFWFRFYRGKEFVQGGVLDWILDYMETKISDPTETYGGIYVILDLTILPVLEYFTQKERFRVSLLHSEELRLETCKKLYHKYQKYFYISLFSMILLLINRSIVMKDVRKAKKKKKLESELGKFRMFFKQRLCGNCKDSISEEFPNVEMPF